MVKPKAEYSSINVKEEDKREYLALRQGFAPNESLHGFFNHLLKVFRETHCPECKSYVVDKIKRCSCKGAEA